MKKPINIVVLPTEDYSHYNITVSPDVETIKEGDWCIKSYGMSGTEELCVYSNDLGNTAIKIIATTDPKLKIADFPELSNTAYRSLPQPQQSFLKEYVDNPDGEYEVEYEYGYSLKRRKGGEEHFYKLKLNQNNEVNITNIIRKPIDNINVKQTI